MRSVHEQRIAQRVNAAARARLIHDGYLQEDDKMSDVTTYERAAEPMTANEIIGQVQRIQQVVKAVMKEGVHFGKIPGTPKPTLFKPGAEVLAVTFRISPSYQTDDLSTSDEIRYRVTCTGTHQLTGVMLGQGLGEASSNEEKYKWRRAVSKDEFDNTTQDRKRVKYGKDYKAQQVRTEPADIANTVLKMAAKRAQVAMTLNVLAASDMFSQDLEDMSEELREHVSREDGEVTRTVRQPQAKQEKAGPATEGSLTEGQVKILRAKMEQFKVDDAQIIKELGVPLEKLPFGMFGEAQKFITGGESKPAA